MKKGKLLRKEIEIEGEKAKKFLSYISHRCKRFSEKEGEKFDKKFFLSLFLDAITEGYERKLRLNATNYTISTDFSYSSILPQKIFGYEYTPEKVFLIKFFSKEKNWEKILSIPLVVWVEVCGHTAATFMSVALSEKN